jgi:hypothetical protein
MNRNHVLVSAVASVLAAGSTAIAVPVNGFYVDDARLDNPPNQALSHELGEHHPPTFYFPINEGLEITVNPSPIYIVPDDGIQNDWIVRILNISGQAWTDLFFVADLGLSIGNADGSVYDTVPLPGTIVDAFRIDGTVTPGVNNNLLSESMVADEILSPMEVWQFAVTNYADPAGTSPPPLFRAPGMFANTEPFGTAPNGSTASILANPIPEPGAVAVAALGAGLTLLRRRRYD